MFLEEISDDYLVKLFFEKNQEAIDLLFDRYTKFIYGIIRDLQKKENEYLDFEDLFQECFLMFLMCIQRYDEEQGNFYFFVRKTIERKISDKLKVVKRQEKFLSLDGLVGERSCLLDYVAEDSSNDYCSSHLYEMLMNRLDEDCGCIVDMKMMGYSYQEIAKIMKVTKQSVYRCVRKIKNILKDIIEKID